MSSDTGLNQTAAEAAINNIISGGADVRLLTTAVDYDDGDTELSAKEVSGSGYAAQSVAEADWTLTPDAVDGTLTLTNDNVIDFGQAGDDWGTVVDVVVHAPTTDEFIRLDAPTDPNITTGAEVSIAAGAAEYTLGNTTA